MSHHSGYIPAIVFRQDPDPPLSLFRRLTGITGDFPEVIIAGAQKSGTTSLFGALASHPDFGRVGIKEPFYYGNDDRYSRGKEYYLSNYPHKRTCSFSVDATTNYLDHPLAAKRIKQDNPKVKVIIMLRDPVYRAFSHYKMQKKIGSELLTFREALDLEKQRIEEGKLFSNLHNYCYQRLGYRTRGEYSRMLPFWLEEFDASQLYILQAEAFYADPIGVYKTVTDFLGLKTHNNPDLVIRNAGDKGKMDDESFDLLCDHYRPFNAQLKTQLRTKFTYEWVC